MDATIVNERDLCRTLCNLHAVRFGGNDAAAHAARILDLIS